MWCNWQPQDGRHHQEHAEPVWCRSSASRARASRPERCVKPAADLVTEQDPGLHDRRSTRPACCTCRRTCLHRLGTTTVYEADLNALTVDTPGPNALAAFEELAVAGQAQRALPRRPPPRPGLWSPSIRRSRQRSPNGRSTRRTCSRRPRCQAVHGRRHRGPHRPARCSLQGPPEPSVGESTWKWSDLQTAAVNAAKAGFQLHFHAIGDSGLQHGPQRHRGR